jgi:hypothetical protein
MRPVSEEDEVIGLPRNSFYLMSNQHTADVLPTI